MDASKPDHRLIHILVVYWFRKSTMTIENCSHEKCPLTQWRVDVLPYERIWTSSPESSQVTKKFKIRHFEMYHTDRTPGSAILVIIDLLFDSSVSHAD